MTSASKPSAQARPARGRRSLALAPPAPRGDQVKIEDDGNAAEQIVAYLAEKRLI